MTRWMNCACCDTNRVSWKSMLSIYKHVFFFISFDTMPITLPYLVAGCATIAGSVVCTSWACGRRRYRKIPSFKDSFGRLGRRSSAAQHNLQLAQQELQVQVDRFRQQTNDYDGHVKFNDTEMDRLKAVVEQCEKDVEVIAKEEKILTDAVALVTSSAGGGGAGAGSGSGSSSAGAKSKKLPAKRAPAGKAAAKHPPVKPAISKRTTRSGLKS